MEEKKQGFLGKNNCLALFAAMMAAAIVIVLAKPMITGEKKYVGVGAGIDGEVKVEVRIAKGAITAVNVLEHNETEGIGTLAIAQLPEAIVERQNIDVDVVATATITSQAICTAVADAMTQAGMTPAEIPQPETQPAPEAPEQSAATGPLSAGTYTASANGMGEVTVTVTVDEAGTITDVTADGPGETPGIGTNAIEQLPAAILEAQSADVDAVASATITSNAILTAVRDCLTQASGGGAAAVEGTSYTAAATGMGEVTVTIVVDDGGAIVDVQIEGPGETPGIGTNAIEQLPAAILEAQPAEVDTVASATITSNAILTALKDCLAQAGK